MQKVYVVILMLLFGTLPTQAQYRDNTPAFGRVRPNGLVHILDIELAGRVAYAGGAGGLWIIDVGDASRPFLMGTYRPRSGGTRGGAQIYGLALNGTVVYCCERTGGVEVIDVSFPGSPVPVGQRYRRDKTHAYEHALKVGDTLYLAAHESGVEVCDITTPQVLRHVGETRTTNAFALAQAGSALFVADGAGGLCVLDLSDPVSPREIGRAQTTSLAIDVVLDGDYAYVAVGSRGMDVFDIRNPAEPVFVTNYHVDGFSNHLNLDRDRVYLANWETVEVVDITAPDRPRLVATQHAFERAMGIAVRDGTFYVGDWATFRIYGYEDLEAPDVNVDPLEMHFGTVAVGSSLALTMRVENVGQVPLSVTGLSASGSGFSVVSSAFTLEPFASQDVQVFYQPTSSRRASGFVSIRSDDPDEGEKIVPLVGGDRTIGVGDRPPDFTLQDSQGNRYRLQELIDQDYVVVMALFASW